MCACMYVKWENETTITKEKGKKGETVGKWKDYLLEFDKMPKP